MYCPACGKAIADGSVFCMHCGKSTGLSMQSVSVPLAPVSTPNAPLCPSCGQMDEARRVQGMVAQGVTLSQSSTTSSGVGVGVGLAGAAGTGGRALGASVQGWSSVSHSQTVAVTALASLLAAPNEGISAYNRSLMPPDPSGGKKFISPYSTAAYSRWSAELSFRDNLVFSGFENRVERLYYCSRCAVVYVPGEGDFASLNDVGSLIYRYPSDANEVCELQSGLWGGSWFKMAYYHALFAMAYYSKGVQCIKEAIWEETGVHITRYPTNLDYRGRTVTGLNPDSNKTRSNYDRLVAELEAVGWVRQAEQGPNWWQARFVR